MNPHLFFKELVANNVMIANLHHHFEVIIVELVANVWQPLIIIVISLVHVLVSAIICDFGLS